MPTAIRPRRRLSKGAREHVGLVRTGVECPIPTDSPHRPSNLQVEDADKAVAMYGRYRTTRDSRKEGVVCLTHLTVHREEERIINERHNIVD